jgi:hypothetical protein
MMRRRMRMDDAHWVIDAVVQVVEFVVGDADASRTVDIGIRGCLGAWRRRERFRL